MYIAYVKLHDSDAYDMDFGFEVEDTAQKALENLFANNNFYSDEDRKLIRVGEVTNLMQLDIKPPKLVAVEAVKAPAKTKKAK